MHMKIKINNNTANEIKLFFLENIPNFMTSFFLDHDLPVSPISCFPVEK